MVKLQNILKELLDIYDINDLKSKGIKFKTKDFDYKYEIYLQYKDSLYKTIIYKDEENPYSIEIMFGLSNKSFSSIDMKTLTNSSQTPIILSSIFSLIVDYVNKNNITQIQFDASDEKSDLREKLYDLYMRKNFPNFIKSSNKNLKYSVNQIIYNKK